MVRAVALCFSGEHGCQYHEPVGPTTPSGVEQHDQGPVDLCLLIFPGASDKPKWGNGGLKFTNVVGYHELFVDRLEALEYGIIFQLAGPA
jgi:hypothetical protein